MSEPLIVGIRHHSPACARLVKLLIESQRPRYVLIEGPADFNDRVDELFLAHQLPVAIYSYCQYQDGAAPGRGAWTPFAEFSPEWQALQAARRIQAQTYFIDLPCWAQSEEEDESPDTQDDSQTLLLRATRMDNSDTLWDHLFEDESQQTALPSALARYFAQLRGDSPRRCSQSSARSLYGSLDYMGDAAKQWRRVSRLRRLARSCTGKHVARMPAGN